MLTRDDLKDYQRQGIQHIFDNDRCALWMRMGAGKTVTTLTALDDLSAVETVWPALVVAPLRVARSVWPDEPPQWAHLAHLRVTPVLGTPSAREKALREETELYAINFDNLVWLREALGSRWPFRTVVIDEATRLAGLRTRQGSKRAAALRDVAHTAIDRFIELTGTPAPNGLIKLWGQLWFLDHGERLGKTYTAFEERWFTKGWDGYSTVPLPHSSDEIHRKIDDLCLTIEGDPVDEPVVIPVPVELPQTARKLYRDMEKELFMEVEGHEVEAFSAATKTNKCLQMANGAAYVGEDAKDWVEVHRAKLEALESLIEEANGAPVLVAYNFRSDLARLRKAFPGGKVLDADGKVIKDWNAGKVPLLFAHPKSAGHGLNLARGGNILVFFGLDWDLEAHEQIIERIGPRRQKAAGFDRPTYVYLIQAKDTIDEDVVERLRTKSTVQEALMRAARRKR